MLALSRCRRDRHKLYSGSDDKLIKAWRLNEGGGRRACVLILALAPKKHESQVVLSSCAFLLPACTRGAALGAAFFPAAVWGPAKERKKTDSPNEG